MICGAVIVMDLVVVMVGLLGVVVGNGRFRVVLVVLRFAGFGVDCVVAGVLLIAGGVLRICLFVLGVGLVTAICLWVCLMFWWCWLAGY